MDNPDPAGSAEGKEDGNGGLYERHLLTKDSTIFDMVGRLHVDLFQQNRPIIPNVNIRIKMTRTSPTFLLMSTDDKEFQLKIHEAVLLVRTIEPSDDVILHHSEALERSITCKYPVHRCEVESYSISQGVMNHTRAAAVTGQLPVRVVLGLVRNDALNGKYNLNPYDFQIFSLSLVSICCNGKIVGGKAITPNFTGKGNTGKTYLRGYESLFSATDTFFTGLGNNLVRADYESGYTLFAFKISEDFGEDYFGLKREGNLQIELKFEDPTTHPLNVILYLEYLNILEIDKNRFTTFDYNV
jgi:hypothetical protein